VGRTNLEEDDTTIGMFNDTGLEARIRAQPCRQPRQQILVALGLDGVGIKPRAYDLMRLVVMPKTR